MLLGGHVFPKTNDPYELASRLKEKGFKAGYCPNDADLSMPEYLSDLKKAFAQNGIVMAEVGAWCNPMSLDAEVAKQAKEHIIRRLALAEELGARCCVNLIGTHDPESWGSLHPDNFTQAFYDDAIRIYREIIDAVKPTRTVMAFEIVPWNFLDGADGYLRFMKDLDRAAAGYHLDPVNCIKDVPTYLNHVEVFRDAFTRLGRYGICSVHLKDILMEHKQPNVELKEVRFGLGYVDRRALMRIMRDTLAPDATVMLEHLPTEEDYLLAADEARRAAALEGIEL